MAAQGQAIQGLAQLRQGLAVCQAVSVTIDHPYYLSLLADVCGRIGQFEEGLTALSDAFALARRSQAFFHEAELYRLQGELLLQQDPRNHQAAAETSFQNALDTARRQQAKSLELRAAVSLARLWQKQGQGDRACVMLAELCHWFSEGFDTQDWQDAAALLVALGGRLK
jgi:predicted ATPase